MQHMRQIRSMPNSKLHPRPFRWPNGAIFVGDCYNMRTTPPCAPRPRWSCSRVSNNSHTRMAAFR